MVRIFITHKCNGDNWVASWSDSSPEGVPATFEDAGIRVIDRFRGLQDPDTTGLLVEADSMDAFRAFSEASEGNPNFLKLGVDLTTLTYLGSIDQ
ncbi:hypothetical protein [Castellaniella sp. GW247-6E4]|uniref:hypothetical protein n=1 Tax=Castellaniella sp. GW247-6E4 TaxID=3140380 RepID=UPI0033150221